MAVPREVEPEFREAVAPVCQAILACRGEEQVLQRFLRDLWTFAEAERFANRWLAAQHLLEGRNQIETARELLLSPKTIHAVSRFVNGLYATGGFAEIHRRLNKGVDPHGQAGSDETA